ncbi:MAG TPA: 8-amino-7-oxononanoate synthase, partial [Terriglobia bacterium]|nr:8-amino-7-oxononanoate synthase [Terriglobia bacterium]
MSSTSLEVLERRVRKVLRELEAEGLRRNLRSPSGVDLSSNDYLGLSTHPFVKQKMAEAVMDEGCGSTGSRLLRGNRESFVRVEQRFADFKGAESSLYFGSGYAANIGVLSTFIERHDLVFSDELNHASIIDGIRLSRAKRSKFPHCNVDRVARLLREAPSDVQKFLVTESLFSMDGDFAPLADYVELCRQTGTSLIVDEAHAVGIYGRHGSGYVEHTSTNDGVFLTINTAGKALGVSGAFVAGPDWAIDFLIQRARPFIFSTAPPPPVAAALEASLDVIRDEPERRALLLEKSALLRQLLRENGFDIPASGSQIIPIILGDNQRATHAAHELQREGFDVRALRPPTVPTGSARLRITVNAGIEESILRNFALALGKLCSTV